MPNLADFLKDKDSSMSTVWLFSLCSWWGCSLEPKDQMFGNGGRGDADSDMREDEELRESWRIFCVKKRKVSMHACCASLEASPALYPTFYCWRWEDLCLSAGGGFSITCWSQPELHAVFQNKRNKWMVHENTSDIFSLVTCSQRRAEESPQGDFRGPFNTYMGGLIWKTLIFTVKWDAGENTSLLRGQVREFERTFMSKTEQRHILLMMIRLLRGMTWWLDS